MLAKESEEKRAERLTQKSALQKQRLAKSQLNREQKD